MGKIRITESELRKLVTGKVLSVLNEWNDSAEARAYHDEENRYDAQMERDWDYSHGNDNLAHDSFVDGNYMKELQAKFPNMELDFEISPDGGVKIFDINDESGNYYLGQGELETDAQCMNYPSANDRFSQAEEEYEYYDYNRCMAEIAQKIANGQPDGHDIFESVLREKIKNAIKGVLNENNGK